jgi:hypothetical protein
VTDERREVNVLWLRILVTVVAIALFVSLAVYGDHARGPNEPFDPFDPYALREWLWFGDPMTAAAWVGHLNQLSALAYLAAGLGPRGRMRWRGIVVVFTIAGVLVGAGVTGLVYLLVADPASFPVTNGGMLVILGSHALGSAGLLAAWMQLRRAARNP